MSTAIEALAARELERYKAEIGPSEAVDRFLRCYSKVRVQKLYAFHLLLYFRWLKRKEISMGPDQLVADNLRCIYRSEPEDVVTKRRHRAWLEDYANGALGSRSESYRRVAAATVKGFYEKNDSPLFGKVTVVEDPPAPPPKGLKADDIRKVLKALPLGARTLLLCMWQSGVEINRTLALRWRDLGRLEAPLKLTFYGRKRHKKGYFTFLGGDAVEHLKLWREKWEELMERPPAPEDLVFVGKPRNGRTGGMNGEWLNALFRGTALKLARQGLVENGEKRSWHSHMLRHSFKSEGEHAGVPSDFVEFWMGHDGGIKRVYDERDEVHAEDFVNAYRRMEPFVSLDFNEAVAAEKLEEERVSWVREISSLRAEVARLAGSRLQGPQGG